MLTSSDALRSRREAVVRRHIEPTGREFRSRMCALFMLEDGGDGIVCERVHFNPGDIVQQLGPA